MRRVDFILFFLLNICVCASDGERTISNINIHLLIFVMPLTAAYIYIAVALSPSYQPEMHKINLLFFFRKYRIEQ